MSTHNRLVLVVVPLLAACASIAPLQLNSSPKPMSPAATALDHARFDRLLNRYVDREGLVDYHGLRSEAAELSAYLESFAGVDPADLGTDAERKAYWINAYNAITLAGILHHYPTRSIRDLPGFWQKLTTNCGGRLVSLDDIEHSILRPLGDPRIHMAINCASMSCPRLLNRAYTGADLESQLNTAVSDFLGDTHRNRFDSNERSVHLSKIFSWFGDDFAVTPYGGVRGFVRRFGPSHPWLVEEFAISYLPYDWSLNEQPAGQTASRSPSLKE